MGRKRGKGGGLSTGSTGAQGNALVTPQPQTPASGASQERVGKGGTTGAEGGGGKVKRRRGGGGGGDGKGGNCKRNDGDVNAKPQSAGVPLGGTNERPTKGWRTCRGLAGPAHEKTIAKIVHSGFVNPTEIGFPAYADTDGAVSLAIAKIPLPLLRRLQPQPVLSVDSDSDSDSNCHDSHPPSNSPAESHPGFDSKNEERNSTNEPSVAAIVKIVRVVDLSGSRPAFMADSDREDDESDVEEGGEGEEREVGGGGEEREEGDEGQEGSRKRAKVSVAEATTEDLQHFLAAPENVGGSQSAPLEDGEEAETAGVEYLPDGNAMDAADWLAGEASPFRQGGAHLSMNCPNLETWQKRRFFFSKMDQGCLMDESSWYEITPEPLALHMAYRMLEDVPDIHRPELGNQLGSELGSNFDTEFGPEREPFLAACCGVGGDSIALASLALARKAGKVVAVDIDPAKIAKCRHNAKIYGVEENMRFEACSIFDYAKEDQGPYVIKEERTINLPVSTSSPSSSSSPPSSTARSRTLSVPDTPASTGPSVGVRPIEVKIPRERVRYRHKWGLVSPPWGGPSYRKQFTYNLAAQDFGVDLINIVRRCAQLCENICAVLPRNQNVDELIALALYGLDSSRPFPIVEIEKLSVKRNGYPLLLAVYFRRNMTATSLKNMRNMKLSAPPASAVLSSLRRHVPFAGRTSPDVEIVTHLQAGDGDGDERKNGDALDKDGGNETETVNLRRLQEKEGGEKEGDDKENKKFQESEEYSGERLFGDLRIMSRLLTDASEVTDLTEEAFEELVVRHFFINFLKEKPFQLLNASLHLKILGFPELLRIAAETASILEHGGMTKQLAETPATIDLGANGTPDQSPTSTSAAKSVLEEARSVGGVFFQVVKERHPEVSKLMRKWKKKCQTAEATLKAGNKRAKGGAAQSQNEVAVERVKEATSSGSAETDGDSVPKELGKHLGQSKCLGSISIASVQDEDDGEEGACSDHGEGG